MTERTVLTRIKADVSDYQRGLMAASAATKAFTNELNTSTDRSTMLTQSLLAVGPSLVPISAAAIPALSGLTNQMGFAVAGAGTMVLAFQGVGDALKATNEYAIEPTDANLKKMQQTMSEIGPAGQEFVNFLQELRPELQGLQDAAQAGLFPGMQSGITDLMTRLPQVERIVAVVSDTIGDLMAEAGSNLASPRWDEFFDFLETEARPTLMDFGRSLGNLGEGFANLWMAFDPLSDRFSKSFLQMTRDFSDWTDGLDRTEGFQEFLAYIDRVGPKVWDTLGSLGNALLQIVEAAAPVGEVMLPAIEALADAVAVLANSDVAPLAIGLVSLVSAFSRIKALGELSNSSALGGLFSKSAMGGGLTNVKAATAATRELAAAQTVLATNPGMQALSTYKGNLQGVADAEKKLGEATKARNRQFISGGLGAASMALVMSDLDDKMGLTNTAMGAMAGSLAGPWGAAAGAGIGLAMDFASANDDVWSAVTRANSALAQGPENLEMQRAAIRAAREEIDALRESTDVGAWELPGLGDAIKDVKDNFEGLFGKSDNEEASEALAELEDKYAENARAAQDLEFAQAGLGDSMDDASDSARDEAQAIIDLRNEHNRAADAALASRDAERAYQEAIDNAADSIKENGKTLDITTPKGRANAEAIDQIVASFNNMDYATQQSSGGMKAARDEYVKATVAAGGNAEAARKLANELLLVKSPPPINITAKDHASDVIDSIQRARDRLSDKTFTIFTKRIENIVKGKQSDAGNEARAPRATGGAVAGPGTGTSDDIPAWLSNGEHVLTADEVVKAGGQGAVYRMRAAIRSGLMPAFASGGAVDGGRYDRFQELEHSSKLELAQQQKRIKDIEKSLTEKETVGKGKNKHKRLVLRGLDRKVAELELDDAKRELKRMKAENAELKNGGYGTSGQEKRRYESVERAEDARKEAEDAAIKAAEDVVKEAADRFTSAKTSAGSKFEIGSATSAASVDRNLSRMLADSQTFLGLLGDLKSKGASPWLLEQLVGAGPTKGAIKLARQYGTDSAALASINARASQIDQYTNAYAGLVGNSAFMAPAAWNSGISSASQAGAAAAAVINVYPSEGMSETNLANIVGGQLAWRM